MLRQTRGLTRVVATGALLACIAALPAAAKDFRLALHNDANSLDSMRNWDALTLATTNNIYDPLLDYESDVGFIPRLAVSWEQVEPKRWRFNLRKNVTFHDGQPFTADDVVFSAERMRSPTSRGRKVLRSLDKVVKVDDHTVDFHTTRPDPLFINQFNTMIMMSKSWAEANNTTVPADFSKEEVNHAVMHANGTGPFKVESREQGVKMVLVRNDDWWGWSSYPRANIDRVILTPIKESATRVAALLSGEVDMISPVPVQDVKRVQSNAGTGTTTGHEARAVFLGMDQARDELLYSDVKGKNPFKDVRVRRAIGHALSFEALNRVVFRGLAAPAAMIIPQGVAGFDPQRKRLPYDPEKAKELLAEAGYPDGFSLTLDCSAGREIGDKESCEAIVTMLAQVGIKVDLLAQPAAKWYGKIVKLDTSFYRMSWGNNGWSGTNTLSDLTSCREGKSGGFNMGSYCNPEVDKLTASLFAETDAEARAALLAKAYDIVEKDVAYVPMYYPPIIWGTVDGVEVKVRTDGRVYLPHVSMQ